MSWDGMIIRFPKNVVIEELPDDWSAPVLGSQQECINKLKSIFREPEYLWHGTIIETESTWVELSCLEEPVDTIHIRTNATPVSMQILQKICEAFSAYLFDCQSGEIAEFDNQTIDSMNEFCNFRDKVIQNDS